MAKDQGKKGQGSQPKPQVPATRPADTGVLVLMGDIPPPAYLTVTGAGRGNEQVGVEDLVIPRLELIQALSPIVTQGSPEYNPQAKAGGLTNSVTNELYGTEVFVVPVMYNKLFLVWKDRKKGGGFRGSFPTIEEANDRCQKEGGAKEGFEVVDTPTHLCLLVDKNKGTVDEVMVALPRTKAKVSRQWNSMIRMAGGDRFSRVYRVTSGVETNAKGTYHNYAIAQCGFPAERVYAQAVKLYEQIQAGKKSVVMDTSGFDRADSDASQQHGESSEM